MATPLLGIDVSSHQGSIDWAKVKGDGMTFAIVRCVRESGNVDPNYAKNVAAARKAGMVTGAYAFLSGGMAKSQAKTFIKAVGNPAGMLIALDIERPSNKAHAVPTFADVQIFAKAWKAAHPKHPLLLYGSAGSVLGSIGAKGILSQFGRLWLARYRTGHGTAAMAFYESIGGIHANEWRKAFSGWTGPSFWQFTSQGVHVAGIASKGKPRRVDIDAYRGTMDQLLSLTGNGAAPAAPPPPADPAKVAPGERVFHVVKPGETLSAIAKRFGFSGFTALIAMFPENQVFKKNPNLIHPGDRVRVA